MRHIITSILLLLTMGSVSACSSSDGPDPEDDAVVIGGLFPFSGEQAAVGFNAERAVSLAIRDVNAAGGVAGRPVYLLSRDSNSGSDAGYEQARKLLYEENVPFLIGPEENPLAKKLVSDVKAKNILNILPGFSAPVIRNTGSKGAWLRLAPHPKEVGCAMALHAAASGLETASTLVAPDDYQLLLASEFNAYYGSVKKSLGTISISSASGRYENQLRALNDQSPEVAVLMAYPSTASRIMQDWTVIGDKDIRWYFSPTLLTEMFLQNVPLEALYENTVFSPTGSLEDECTAAEAIPSGMNDTDSPEESPDAQTDGGAEDTGGPEPESREDTLVAEYNRCRQDNFNAFLAHYSEFAGHDTPSLASLYYYDAVVLLALGLSAATADDNPDPTPAELKVYIREIAEPPGETVSWQNIEDGLNRINRGEDIVYAGAAARYLFDERSSGASYGLARHRLIDIWSIDGFKFTYETTISVNCALLDEI